MNSVQSIKTTPHGVSRANADSPLGDTVTSRCSGQSLSFLQGVKDATNLGGRETLATAIIRESFMKSIEAQQKFAEAVAHHSLPSITVDDGDGTRVFVDLGMKYHGELSENTFQGRGTACFRNGSIYEGGWQDGMPHGYGVWTDVYGDILYEGLWNQGSFSDFHYSLFAIRRAFENALGF